MLRSVLTNWIAMVVTGAVSLALTPILIHGLGDFHYGMWILVASLLEYSSFIDMGLRTTLQRFTARLQGAHDRKALNQTLATALALAIAVCFLLGILSLVFSAVLPGFFGLKGPERVLFARVVLLLGASVAVTFPARVLASFLCGMQRYDLFNLAAIVSSLARAGLLVAALHRGYGVIGCSLVSLGVAAVSLVMHWFLVRWVDPESSFQWSNVSWARARELSSFSIYVFLASMGDFLRFRIDSFVIARWLTMSLVTPFNIASRIIEYFRSALFTVMGPMMTTMSALDGQSRQTELRHAFLRFTRMTALVSFFIASILVLDGKAILRAWVGTGYLSAYAPLVVLAVGHALAMAQSPSINLLLARGRNRELGWWTLGEGLLNLVLSIYWAREYGVIGVALGTAVPQIVIRLTLQPLVTLRVAGITVGEYFSGALAGPLTACGAFLGLAWVGSVALPLPGLLGLLCTVAWQGALFAGLAYSLGLKTTDRNLMKERGRQIALTLRPARAV